MIGKVFYFEWTRTSVHSYGHFLGKFIHRENKKYARLLRKVLTQGNQQAKLKEDLGNAGQILNANKKLNSSGTNGHRSPPREEQLCQCRFYVKASHSANESTRD